MSVPMRTLAAADPYPFAGQQLPCYIGGEFTRQARAFENVSPVNGRVIATVSEADAAAVDRAVRAARAALLGPWGRMSTAERVALLRKVLAETIRDPAFIAEAKKLSLSASHAGAEEVHAAVEQAMGTLDKSDMAELRHIVLERYYQ